MALQTAQTHPDYWHEPLEFHPERFLPPTHEWYDTRFQNDNKDTFHPFSLGNRNCLGYKYVTVLEPPSFLFFFLSQRLYHSPANAGSIECFWPKPS